MATTLSLAHHMVPLGSGMQSLVSMWEIHIKGTHLQLPLDHMTTLSEFGMQPLVSMWEIHLKGTQVQSPPLPIHLMVPTLCYGPTHWDYISTDLVNFSLFILSYLIDSNFKL